MNRYYLDHNASSTLTPVVADAMRASIADPSGNPGGVHWHGQRARALVERTRRQVRQRLGVSEGNIVFTSGATEANNTVIASLAQGARVLVSPMEHASVLAPLAARPDLALVWIPNDDMGVLDVSFIENAVAEGPAALFVCAANNEIGNLNPIDEIAGIAQRSGSCLHVDAVQVFGRYPWSVPKGCTSITMSAHKAGGPVGVGALWASERASVQPLLHGGAQERGRRAGTENTLALAGFHALLVDSPDPRWAAVAQVRDAMQQWLQDRFGVEVNGGPERLPNTLHCSFRGRDAEEIVMALDLEQVSIAAGSACSAGSNEVSHVLRAMRDDAAWQSGGVRISFGPEHCEMDLQLLQERFDDALS